MKTKFLYLIMAFALVMPFVSCDKDDDGYKEIESKHDPISDEDQTEIVAFDALEWLQSGIVVVNNNNEVVRRVCGKPLDASQPTVISVPVKSLASAEEIFLGWVAPGKETVKVEGGYDYNLTDADGNAQGSVSFRAVEGEQGVIARMSVAEGTPLKLITEVNFIDYDMWPENEAVEKYEAGKTYWFDAEVYEWKVFNEHFDNSPDELWTWNRYSEFYCIQGNDNGKEAILVWLCPDANDRVEIFSKYNITTHPEPKYYFLEDMYKKLPTLAEAQKVLDFYNENYDAWQKMLKVMDDKRYKWSADPGAAGTTGNSEFLLNSYDSKKGKIKCLDFDSKKGEICNVYYMSWFSYRYMHILIFPPYNN